MISKKAIAHLRALGHALDPVVQIGKAGVSHALVLQTLTQLAAHELIKVRVATEAPLHRNEAAAALAVATDALLAQVIGRTFLLYKPHPEKPRIILAKAKKAPVPGASGSSRPPREPAAKKSAKPREPLE